MILTVKVSVNRTHLLWAACFLLCRNEKLSKSAVLKFLREQMARFGEDENSLCGLTWQQDYCDQLPEAETWLNKAFDRE